MDKPVQVKSNTLVGYITALIIGIAVGFRWSPEFVGFVYILTALVCVYLALQNNVKDLLSILPYIVYSELYIRAFVTSIPYLFVQYLLIALCFIMMIRGGANVKVHSRNFFLLVLFLIIEFVNSTRSLNPEIARSLLMNSLALVVTVIWSSFNYITPILANRILNSVKYASIYLCGIVVARYLMGDVVFSHVSGSEGVNGLAPVQISGYLGFSCTIFFLSIMNNQERHNLILNLALIALCAIIMVLSFSRGGLYFFCIMMILYFLFHRKDVKSYFLFLLLIPVAFVVYNYVYEKTNGLIEDRYEQEGTSGRQQLVEAGWKLFVSNPLVGIGPSNFGSQVLELKLYDADSGAHNEFIRVAAEDGILGIVTYWGFFIFIFIEILGRGKIQREYAIYFLLFYFLITIHNGLKISLQPLLVMLAVATPTVKVIKRRKNVTGKQEFAARLTGN